MDSVTGDLFELGSIVATPAALRLILRNGINPAQFLVRHKTGDWSEMSAEDQASNRHAAANQLRVFSSYSIGDSDRVWVITEADRRHTTIFLPSEY
jgi:hypothetical protein